MELKDKLIQKIAKENNLHVDTVEKVISFAGRKTHQAFKSNNSVELSGFGTFKISLPKIRRKIKGLEKLIQDTENSLLQEDLDSKTRERREDKLNTHKTKLEILKERMNA